MIFLDFCFFSNSIRYFLGHPIDCWLYWWVLPRYMYISSNDKVVRAKKGTGGLHLVKTVKTWSPSSFPSSPPYPEHPHSHHHHELQSRCKRSSSPRTQSPSPLSSAPSSRKSSATISSQLDIEHFFCTFLSIFDVQLLGLFHKYVEKGSIGLTWSV